MDTSTISGAIRKLSELSLVVFARGAVLLFVSMLVVCLLVVQSLSQVKVVPSVRDSAIQIESNRAIAAIQEAKITALSAEVAVIRVELAKREAVVDSLQREVYTLKGIGIGFGALLALFHGLAQFFSKRFRD